MPCVGIYDCLIHDNASSGRPYKSKQVLGLAIIQCPKLLSNSTIKDAFQKWAQR